MQRHSREATVMLRQRGEVASYYLYISRFLDQDNILDSESTK